MLLIVDAADLTANPNGLAARDTDADPGRPEESKAARAALVLNKIDGMKRTDLLPLVETLPCRRRVRGCVPDLRAEGRRRRRCRGLGGGAHAAKGPGSIRKTRPPTFPRACWRPRSRARKSICACMTNCPMPARWKPRNGKSARTARSGSTR